MKKLIPILTIILALFAGNLLAEDNKTLTAEEKAEAAAEKAKAEAEEAEAALQVLSKSPLGMGLG